jgi:polar amino acid transport system permease protein
VLAIFIYYALPFLGVQFEPFAAGVWSLFLSSSAFVTEYFRAGIESVNRGHVEAARSLGFSALKTMRLIILPQAIKIVIPPLTGQMVGLLKATAFISVVGMPELLKRAMEVMEWKANPTPLVTVTIIYLIVLFPLIYFSDFIEKRLGKWAKRHS